MKVRLLPWALVLFAFVDLAGQVPALGSQQPQLVNDALMAGATWNDPSVVLDSGYVMYASSDRSFDGRVAIYRLVSSDAQTWVRDPEAPVLTPSPDARAWDHGAVETPSVVRFHGVWHLFYTGYATSSERVTEYRIGHATSPDGISWTKDSHPLVGPDANQEARKFVVAEPAAVVYRDQIFVYFTQLGRSFRPEVLSTWQTLGLIRFDGRTWSRPVTALEPDLALHPRWKDSAAHQGDLWKGYSTPGAVVIGDRVHLFWSVVDASTQRQVRLHHAVSADGLSDWRLDSRPILEVQPGTWYSREVRSPSAVLEGTHLRLWWAGDDGATLGIGGAFWDIPNN